MVNEERERYDDECLPSATTGAQTKVEASVTALYESYLHKVKLDPDVPELVKKSHIAYLNNYLKRLPSVNESLDCSRAWLCYWITHSLSLMKVEIEPGMKSTIVDFLKRCQCDTGGFGGGPGQYAHLAPTYAAVNTLCVLGTQEAYEIIDRAKLSDFLWSVRVGDGSFYMHLDGEIDMRSAYCALVVAKLTNVYSKQLFDNTAEWIARCQSYEGGFSGVPGLEAHGGYSFCALASLYLLSSHHLCDLKALLRWTTNRQMRYEGGFQGRTNKLVDSCYSFWQGASVSLICMILAQDPVGSDGLGINLIEDWLFDNRALQEYILVCCQDPGRGGFADKPRVPRDPYHTCYALSGLSVAQNLPKGARESVGTEQNYLEPINPVFNLLIGSVKNAFNYFSQLDDVVNLVTS